MIQKFAYPVKDNILDFFDTESIRGAFIYLSSSNAILRKLKICKEIDIFLFNSSLPIDAVEIQLQDLLQKHFITGYQFPYEHVLCAYAVAVYKMGDLEKLKELDSLEKHSENFWFGKITKTLYEELKNEEDRINRNQSD